MYDLVKEPSWGNAGFLAWDVAATCIPFVPGSYVTKGGKLLKVARHADEVADGAKSIKHFDDAIAAGEDARLVTILGENMDARVIPFADITGARTLPWGATADEWAKMTPKQRWKMNDGLLRKRINEGDKFRYIGQDPIRTQLARQRFDLTASELLRLSERGIPYEVVSPDEVMRVIGRL